MSLEVCIENLNTFAIYLNGFMSREHLSGIEIFLTILVGV
jgi:hypothetical protein